MPIPDQPPRAGATPKAGRGEIDRLRVEHTAAVQALQSAIRDTTRLTRLFAILSEPAPLAQLLDRVLSTLSELFLADIVVLLDASGGGFVPLAMIGVPADSAHEAIRAAENRHAAAALRSGAPVLVPQARADPDVDAFLRDLDAETIVWLPVTGDQAARGVLVMARCRPIPFARADVDLLRAMAYRVGLILDRSHAEQERQALESRMRQAEKAESLGRMASAIAHHFNNMLLVVLGSLDMVMQDLAAGHKSRDDVLRAREAARRAAKTSGLMLAYLGQGVGLREPVNMTEVARDAVETLRASLPANVRLIVNLGEPELTVVANVPQITELLANLLVNSWEAIDAEKGEVCVTVRAVPAAKIPVSQLVAAEGKPQAEAYVCLEVADSGCGMTPETIGKVFDPFFTTKFIGRGLGLPVVLGTVRAHDGFVSVQSQIGIGTTFRVFLPLAGPALRPAAKPPATAAPAVAPHELVLLVDDEDIVRRMVECALDRFGYEVITAADGFEAVEQFARQRDAIRFVILDLTMPRMDGWATLAAIRTVRPEIPVIMSSGYDEAQVLAGRQMPRPPVFLHKPYTFDELRAAIQKALAAAEAGAVATTVESR